MSAIFSIMLLCCMLAGFNIDVSARISTAVSLLFLLMKNSICVCMHCFSGVQGW